MTTANLSEIEERKQAEAASRRLAAIVESSNDAIISQKMDGTITSWNKGAERIFCYSTQEVIGQSIETLIPRDRRDEQRIILERLKRGEQIDHLETVHQAKDGRLVHVSLTISALKDAGDEIVGAVKVARDITEQKQGEENLRTAQEQLRQYAEELERRVAKRTTDLQQSNEQLETFAYSIAHDLRNPTRAIEAFSNLLLDDYGSSLDETGLGYVRHIKTSAEFMDKLLLDLLEYARIAPAALELGSVNVKAAWQAALFQCQQQVEATQARVEVTSALPVVRAHEATLSQVLANLLSNALRFVAQGVRPEIRFSAEERDDTVRLWMHDNGIGISPENYERIFRVFERLHGATYGGTGIGLAIVRKGVQRMGGRVGVESVPGQGSRFWIELPKG